MLESLQGEERDIPSPVWDFSYQLSEPKRSKQVRALLLALEALLTFRFGRIPNHHFEVKHQCPWDPTAFTYTGLCAGRIRGAYDLSPEDMRKITAHRRDPTRQLQRACSERRRYKLLGLRSFECLLFSEGTEHAEFVS